MAIERRDLRIGLLLLALAGLVFLLVGCGGGSSSTGDGSSTPSAAGPEPNSHFKTSHGGEKIVDFGKEGSLKEWEAVNALVIKNLETREAGDWAGQCETLSQAGIEEISGAKSHNDCAARLKEIGEPLSRTKKLREDTLAGSIAVLRVDGEKGYALYHGNDGGGYAVPLEREAGKWGVSKLTTINLDVGG